MTPLTLAFMGSPELAVPGLAALIAAGHRIAMVYAQPPRPAGRGHRPQPSSVHAFAESQGLSVRTPTTLRDPAEQEVFAALRVDAAVVVAYGLLLPSAILKAPRLGAVNAHFSLLPRWRGAAPVQRALLAGDRETGVTIMAMDAGLDTGPILLQEAVTIADRETALELGPRLADVGARLLVRALDGLASGDLAPHPQSTTGVTLAPKLRREEGRLDWRQSAIELDRRVRAFVPWPGAWFETAAGERIKVLAAEPAVAAGAAGTVLGPGLTVACGEGALRLTRVQRSGRAAMSDEDLLRGLPLPRGTRLPPP